VWQVGVKLDEPLGKNDGSIKGKRYFDCGGENFGTFIRGKHVIVGDYPERSLLDELEDDDDDDDDEI